MSNEEIIQAMRNFCENYDYSFYDDYSGRGMFGKRCVGIVADDTIVTILQLCDYLRDSCDFEDSYADLFGSVKEDSMGMSRIMYFPNISVED